MIDFTDCKGQVHPQTTNATSAVDGGTRDWWKSEQGRKNDPAESNLRGLLVYMCPQRPMWNDAVLKRLSVRQTGNGQVRQIYSPPQPARRCSRARGRQSPPDT